MYFLFIAASVADIAALYPKGANMFFPSERADFINFGKNLAKLILKYLLILLIYLFVLCLILYQLTYCSQLFL